MRLVVAVLGILAMVSISQPGIASEASEAPSGDLRVGDIISEPSDPVLTPQAFEEVDFFAGDPLRLVAQAPFLRRHSLDTDKFTVWLCDLPGGADFAGPGLSGYVDFLNTTVHDWYVDISGGNYNPVFTAGGSVVAQNAWSDEGGTKTTCNDEVRNAAPAGFEAAFIITDDDLTEYDEQIAGIGGSSFCFESIDCPFTGTEFPDNRRKAIVEGKHIAARVADTDPWTFRAPVSIHEVGHVLHWPHSSSDPKYAYDNPMEVMGGPTEWQVGPNEFIPSGTIAFNRYMSGWIEPDDVVVASGATSLTLQPYDVSGKQMLVIPTGVEGKFYALGARANGESDPITSGMEGVEAYLIDWINPNCRNQTPICYTTFHYQTQYPSSSFGTGHVLRVGDSVSVAGVNVSVTGRAGKGFTVVVGGTPPPPPPPDPIPRFLDVPDSHTFSADIEWMADEAITKGCNPPGNTLFCPDSVVTRGQMAAFLVRALGLTDRLDDPFVDDDESIFQADIERLAAAGITMGCNPPGNTRFCPDGKVTREQMAAFLVRALGYTDDGGGDLFTDDDVSIFEGDIDRMATAGVTKGCNPPTNDRFCPTAYVTRSQMAAFLHRALG